MYPSEARYLMSTTSRPEPVMVRGSGSRLWDSAGREYLDFVQGWATNALGHAAPEVARALSAQAELLVTASPAYYTAPTLELARRLVELSGLHQAYFSCTGAEATELALKLARKWGRLHRSGAFEVISTRNSFHGRTLAAMAASGKPGWDALFPPVPPGFVKVEYGSVEAVANAVTASTAAILVEPIQGEAGVVVPSRNYLSALRALADERRLLLILDEVQTGMGRTGRLFAHDWAAVKPDILTLGKGLGGGIPISATLANERASCLEHGEQGGTFHGAPLACSVALHVLDAITDPDLLANVVARGAQLARGLRELVTRYDLVEHRGLGLLQALVFRNTAAPLVRDLCLERGLLVNAARDEILRFMPSLRITEAEVSEMLTVLGSVIADVMDRTKARTGASGRATAAWRCTPGNVFDHNDAS